MRRPIFVSPQPGLVKRILSASNAGKENNQRTVRGLTNVAASRAKEKIMQARAKGRCPYRIACALLICSAMSVAHAQVFTSLISLDANNEDPEFVTLVQGFNGNLYGTSSVGGGFGSVFRVTT